MRSSLNQIEISIKVGFRKHPKKWISWDVATSILVFDVYKLVVKTIDRFKVSLNKV